MPPNLENIIIARIRAANMGHSVTASLSFIKETDSGGLAVGLACSCKRRAYAGSVHIPKTMRAALEGRKPNKALDNLFII